MKECDPAGKNFTNFDVTNDTPQLSAPTSGGTTGSLTIHDGNTVQPNKFAVGVGMSGKGIDVCKRRAQPEHQFTPKPEYYVVAANEVIEGEVMDIKTITQSGPLVLI